MPEDSGASRHCAYLVVDGVNPGLTDLFTRQARKTMQEQQKSSVLQKLKQEPPAHKPAAPKKPFHFPFGVQMSIQKRLVISNHSYNILTF